MYFLGWDFIISSLIWLSLIAGTLYIFREPIKKYIYGKSDFDVFIHRVKEYLSTTYPKVKFDFTVIANSKSEPNPDARKYMIVDNMVEQYMALGMDKSKYPKPISKDQQWSSYTFNCEPNRDKLPKDWNQRKSALVVRDHKKCFRCSKKVDLNSVQVHMIVPLSKGGKYYLENLLPVCRDCDKVLSKDPKRLNYLDIKDDLNDIIKSS
jgi:hypothetical protein